MICLDSNVVFGALNQPLSPLRVPFNRALVGDAPVPNSSIVLYELWYGVAKGEHRSHNTARITDFLAGPVKVLNLDAEDARKSGDIRAVLARAGTPIGPYDVLIAAQARRRGAILVTANK